MDQPRRHRAPARGAGRSRSSAVKVIRSLAALAAVAALVGTGSGWRVYHGVTSGLTQSEALAGEPTSNGGTQNVLIMGLDSRLDEKGKPLPSDVYDALHAGDDSVGGYNANVLILLHIPGDGSKASAISIPRDDYVELSGCTASPCKGKIKQAYGQALARSRDALAAKGVSDPRQLEQLSREAGRKAEIATVRQFLGGVPIDHFLEVTLVAFFQIAQVVAPIEVCVNEDTSDSYSGARFHKGKQEIDASQAVAFVRQRRDPDTNLMFTDLDRDRRQQAFLVSLSRKLNESGTLTSMSRLQGILDVAEQNIAVDANPDLASLMTTARHLSGGNIAYYTLPIDHFGTTDAGEDVNIVDADAIHGIVGRLLGSGPADAGVPTSTTPGSTGTVAGADGVVLNVVNSSGQVGLAGQLESNFAARGFTRGAASNGPIQKSSSVQYGPGSAQPARQLASMLGGLSASARPNLPAGTVQVTVGTDFALPPSLSNEPGHSRSDLAHSTPTSPQSAVPVVPATATGNNAPAPTDLTSLGGDDVPCVK
ncbi:LytR family transcriptional regulator [Nocardiaceae bacterium YC2-7]|uniref:LytR family transcriptional regulator n=1 Tax=Antrihabitans stalactiti TaxID=2584121 RepID=A0A848K9F1_9NOCA|nr:LytR family transcriptional regulator [Antrihabitans stalactiti]